MHYRLLVVIAFTATCTFPCWISAQDQSDVFDFVLHKDFLQRLRDNKTIAPTFDLTLTSRSDIHGLSGDCEAHVAATFKAKRGFVAKAFIGAGFKLIEQ